MTENSDRHLIGLDLGTSAIKGVRTDARGRVLAEAVRNNRLIHPRPGWVEVSPGEHYRNLCDLLRQLATGPGHVVALAMAAASGNTLLTDAAGTPLTPIINWMDQRAVREPPATLTGLTEAEVRDVTGWPCVNMFPLAHLAWLRENQPDLYAAAAHVGMDTDWLLSRLTGKWLMDHSTATTFHLQDQRSSQYHEPFLRRFGLSRGKLSRLVNSGTAAGPLTATARADTGLGSDTLVVTGCFDHPAAALATGVLAPGHLMLSCGTSWVGFTPSADRRQILAAEMLCDPFLTEQGGPWGGMFSVPMIGQNVEWYVDNVIALGERDKFAVFNELAATAQPGAGGLSIDLRAPPRAVAGCRADISRAVMEGAANLLREKVQGLAARDFKFTHAVLAGGPANSTVWPSIIEQITGLRLRVGTRSAGAQGAAILAGIGAGVYADAHAANAVAEGRAA